MVWKVVVLPSGEGFPSHDELIYVAKEDKMIADLLSRLFEVTELATNFMVKLVLTSMHRQHLIPSCTGLMLKAEMNTRQSVRN